MKIVEYGTHGPVEGAEVYLIVTDDMGNNPSIVGDFETDHSGVVSWPCAMHVESICAQKPESYYGSCGLGYSLGMTWVGDGVYELFPHAWVKVTAIDVEPQNLDQIVRLRHPTNNGRNGISFLSDQDSLVIEAFGNLYDELTYSIRLQSNIDSIPDFNLIPVFCPAFDTSTCQLIH